jgi:hypothetical protein
MLYIYIYIYIFECEIEKGPLDGWDGDLSLTIMLRTKSIERKFKKKYIFLILIVIIHLWSCKKKKKTDLLLITEDGNWIRTFFLSRNKKS